MHKESQQIIQQLESVIHGKQQVLRDVWITFLAGGHVLLEDLPGVGKTTLAKAMGQVISLEEKRVQLTPDTVASDITGFMMFNQQLQQFTLKEGVIMTNVLLADELNRTSARTQAALLEAMQEKQVTIDNISYQLPQPFHVIATQNPSGSTGTQPLPLAQMDRFMTRLTMGYPSKDAQIAMLKNHQHGESIDVTAIASKEQFTYWQQQVIAVHIDDTIYQYVTELTEATRTHPALTVGISPRGALALCQFARARAFYYGRTFVIPEDVFESFNVVCSHRVIVKTQQTAHDVLQQILQQVPSPDEARMQ